MKGVIRRVLAANIKRRVVDLEFRLRVVDARNAGCTLREIAEAAGVSAPTVQRWEKEGRYRRKWMRDEITADLRRYADLAGSDHPAEHGPVTQSK